ncbi:MAG: hypothetical protein ACTHKX_13530 [Pseudolysinimonas sp.]
MTGPAVPDPDPAPESQPAAETQEQRAMRTIRSIFAGGDLAAETLQLSNEFTDRQVERMKRALRRERG